MRDDERERVARLGRRARARLNVIPVYLCAAAHAYSYLKERRNFKPLFKATLPWENLRRIIWAAAADY